jgi:hypothetical protein
MAKDAQCLHGRNGLTAGLLREANSAHKVVIVLASFGRTRGPVADQDQRALRRLPELTARTAIWRQPNGLLQ